MIKKVLKIVILILAVVGITLGIKIAIEKNTSDNSKKKLYDSILGTLQQKS